MIQKKDLSDLIEDIVRKVFNHYGENYFLDIECDDNDDEDEDLDMRKWCCK